LSFLPTPCSPDDPGRPAQITPRSSPDHPQIFIDGGVIRRTIPPASGAS